MFEVEVGTVFVALVRVVVGWHGNVVVVLLMSKPGLWLMWCRCAVSGTWRTCLGPSCLEFAEKDEIRASYDALEVINLVVGSWFGQDTDRLEAAGFVAGVNW